MIHKSIKMFLLTNLHFFLCETFEFFLFFWGQSQKPKRNPVRQPGGNLGFYCVKFTWLAGKSPIFDMRYTFIHGWVYPVSWIFSGEVINHKASFEGAKLKQVSEKEDLKIYTWKLTWNPKIGGLEDDVWKMIFLFNWVIFRFHVKFQGCIFRNHGTVKRMSCPWRRHGCSGAEFKSRHLNRRLGNLERHRGGWVEIQYTKIH